MRHVTRFIPAVGLALALLALMLVPAAVQAQANSVRGPVEKPVPMQILDRPAQDASQPGGGQTQGQQPSQTPGKFKNIDTAKNRRDYDLGTDAPNITVGRDEESGDTVLGHTPPKQKPQGNPFAGQPIEVKPIIIPK